MISALVSHAVDALAVQLAGLTPRRVLDLGTGNGFPGIAVAALWPDAEVVLLQVAEQFVHSTNAVFHEHAELPETGPVPPASRGGGWSNSV